VSITKIDHRFKES